MDGKNNSHICHIIETEFKYLNLFSIICDIIRDKDDLEDTIDFIVKNRDFIETIEEIDSDYYPDCWM